MALNPYLQLPERQYVGARYVPKLAEPFQWDETVVYEPLTIVGYMGSSYTSRKLVPAGTTPVEGEYWALTGNLNGSINQLQVQINTLDTNLEKLETKHETDVSSLETKITTNTTTITQLSQQVNTNKSDIADIRDTLGDINDLIKRSVLIITDSYGNYPTNGTPFTTIVKNNLQNKGTFGTIHTLALSGLGFAPQSVGGATFLTGFTNWVNTNRNIAQKLTDIYVLGGANDCTIADFNQNTIKTAITNFANYARENCPNATLHLAAATKKYLTPYEGRNFQVYLAYQDGGSQNGFDFNPDVSQAMCWTPYLDETDRTHPNQIGASVLAKAVIAWLHGEGFDERVEQKVIIPTSASGVSAVIHVQKIGNIKYTSCSLIGTTSSTLPSTLTLDGKNTAFNPRAGIGIQGYTIAWNGSEFIPFIATWAGSNEYNISIEMVGNPNTIAPYNNSHNAYIYQPLAAYAS